MEPERLGHRRAQYHSGDVQQRQEQSPCSCPVWLHGAVPRGRLAEQSKDPLTLCISEIPLWRQSPASWISILLCACLYILYPLFSAPSRSLHLGALRHMGRCRVWEATGSGAGWVWRVSAWCCSSCPSACECSCVSAAGKIIFGVCLYFPLLRCFKVLLWRGMCRRGEVSRHCVSLITTAVITGLCQHRVCIIASGFGVAELPTCL